MRNPAASRPALKGSLQLDAVILSAKKRQERVGQSAVGGKRSLVEAIALNIDHEYSVPADGVAAPFTHEALPRSVKPAIECLFVSDRHDHPGPESDDVTLST